MTVCVRYGGGKVRPGSRRMSAVDPDIGTKTPTAAPTITWLREDWMDEDETPNDANPSVLASLSSSLSSLS